MRLTRLVYVSKLSANLTKEDMEKILLTARKKNQKNAVTGILFFNSNYFLQCLEGPRDKVNETYNFIVNDSRHSQPTILDYREIHSRDFSIWSMGYAPEYALTAPIILKHSATDQFDPYSMSGESLYLMLLSLKSVLAAE